MSKMEFMESESPVVEWLKDNGKFLVWGLAALFVVLFLLFRLYSSAEVKSEKDYIDASRLQSKIFVPSKAEQSLSELKILVARHPELNAEYDGLMAQAYLNLNQPNESAPLINRTNQRIKTDSLAAFVTSSQIALEISEGKNDTAYPKALSLKENLKDNKGSLYYFNLIRIGMLQEKLKLKKEEISTWEEFLAVVKTGDVAALRLVQAIDADGASFNTFVQERLNKLKQ